MGAPSPRVRLRQAVLAAADLEHLAAELRAGLALGEPFRDPGVGLFGLANTVFALGDCFLEVVSPTQPGTAAGRHLERHGGDCGYMVIFDLEDLAGARARARELGVRTAWEIDLPDISATHLHPADMRGAIVSLDSSNPYGSWRWGGPDWTGRVGTGAPGRLAGVTLAVADPAAVAARWAHVLGVAVDPGDPQTIALQGAEVRFAEPTSFTAAGDGATAGAPAGAPAGAAAEGLTEIEVELPARLRAGRSAIELGGVRWRLL
ncbi:MAG: VOC family protein, partial [Acidobacteriota bacterium]|nr:VOC family protein [Acidobacteriota bacterium]